MSTSETEQPKTEVDPCTPAVSNIWNLFGKSKACKEKGGIGVATSVTPTTPVDTPNLPPVEASNNVPASNESDEPASSGQPAERKGGWFSRGGKRKSKAKKSKRKNRKQKKSRKSRK